MTVSQAPILSNSTFTVTATFNKPVVPFQLSALTVSGATVSSITFSAGSTSCVIVLEGTPGETASVQLTNGKFMDMAMNPGESPLPSHHPLHPPLRSCLCRLTPSTPPLPGASSTQLLVPIPAPGLNTAAYGLNLGSAATMGLSALSCMLSVAVAPGWDSMACAAGVLRSLSHLQVVDAGWDGQRI